MYAHHHDDDDEDDDDETSENQMRQLRKFRFQNKIRTQNTSLSGNNIEPYENVVDETEYDLSKHELLKDLELEIGSNKYPRFNCAAHKINLAVRKAVESSNYLTEMIRKCSIFITNLRKSKHRYRQFKEKKCTLARQNFTRWNSTFEMLFSILKAFRAGLFNAENPCPVEIKDIEIFVQILLPVYIMTNDIQSNKSNISIIVPAVLSLVYGNLDRMVFTEEKYEVFRRHLIKFII